MVAPVVILAAALLVLALSSRSAVKYAVRFSHAAGINQLVVGFLLLAVSTSLPELIVTILSSLKGEGLLGIGTTVGSSFGDISLILGIAILSYAPFAKRKAGFAGAYACPPAGEQGVRLSQRDKHDMEYSILVVAIIALFMLFLPTLDAAFGIFAVLAFFAYMHFIVKQGLPVKENIKGLKTVAAVKFAALALGSIAVLVISARFVVDSAVEISRMAGVPEAAIGATVIAFGAFLPELSLTIIAMRRRNVELALGNLAGSLATNFGLIVGLGALISPVVLNGVSHANLALFLLANAIVLALMQKGRFGKKDAVVLFALYAVFVAVTLLMSV